MIDKEQKKDGLNKIMSVIVYKQGILSDDCEETKNAELDEELYQQ